MMQSHGVKLESAERSYLHLCCRQFGSASKITILDACEYIVEDAEEGRLGEESARLELSDQSYGISCLLVTSQNGQNINSDFGGWMVRRMAMILMLRLRNSPTLMRMEFEQTGSGLTGGYAPEGDEILFLSLRRMHYFRARGIGLRGISPSSVVSLFCEGTKKAEGH
ncbi:MAG: hypothetical protein ACI8Z5_001834 [Lentimonas sp.]|jgi:hypothetical protein